MAGYARKEAALVALFAACESIALFYFVHSSWEKYFSYAAPTQQTPTLYAPEAYRVGIPALYHLIHAVVPHLDKAFFFAGLDTICAFFTVLILYRIAVRGLPGPVPGNYARPIVTLLFLALTHFPFLWIVPWQRPETTPTSLFLAIALWCLLQTEHCGGWLCVAAVATLAQGFMRADLPFIFGSAVMLVALLPHSRTMRKYWLAAGAAMASIAACVQLYLQKVRYPHLSYPPDTAVIQLRGNLSAHMIFDGVVALLPVLLFVVFIALTRRRITPLDTVVLLSAALYGMLWFTVGVVQEVRIFVPMMFALMMVAARTLAPWLTDTPQQQLQD